MRSVWQVVKGPIITEKALEMKEDFESYGRAGNGSQLLALRVAPEATKTEIREAVETIFGVKVTNVNTVNRKGKRKRNRRTGGYGSRPDSKRAIVSLAEGDTIEIFGS
jgi:large subunit ribosomal protein L23